MDTGNQKLVLGLLAADPNLEARASSRGSIKAKLRSKEVGPKSTEVRLGTLVPVAWPRTPIPLLGFPMP